MSSLLTLDLSKFSLVELKSFQNEVKEKIEEKEEQEKYERKCEFRNEYFESMKNGECFICDYDEYEIEHFVDQKEKVNVVVNIDCLIVKKSDGDMEGIKFGYHLVSEIIENSETGEMQPVKQPEFTIQECKVNLVDGEIEIIAETDGYTSNMLEREKEWSDLEKIVGHCPDWGLPACKFVYMACHNRVKYTEPEINNEYSKVNGFGNVKTTGNAEMLMNLMKSMEISES